MDVLVVGLAVAGVATLVLGMVHVVLPNLVDIETAQPLVGSQLRPLPIVGRWYATRRRDVRGVVWVSNNAASYVLLTLGLADVLAWAWLRTDGGRVLALWAAGWWAVRAGSQLAFGRRSGDLLLLVVFAVLCGLHLWAAAT
jgi:hypothetical protein